MLTFEKCRINFRGQVSRISQMTQDWRERRKRQLFHWDMTNSNHFVIICLCIVVIYMKSEDKTSRVSKTGLYCPRSIVGTGRDDNYTSTDGSRVLSVFPSHLWHSDSWRVEGDDQQEDSAWRWILDYLSSFRYGLDTHNWKVFEVISVRRCFVRVTKSSYRETQ